MASLLQGGRDYGLDVQPCQHLPHTQTKNSRHIQNSDTIGQNTTYL
jgi:hypothetical protein